MDLPKDWEKKALILVGVVVLIIVIYAFNPFASKANVTTSNQTANPTVNVPMPFDQPTANSNNTNNNGTSNGTFQLTAEQAKNIAAQSRPGYTAGDPIQETIVISGVNIGVWKVPLTKTGMPSKTVYIDLTSGKIVKET
ncbi:MAG: PepSY domain-containing protein [Methanobacteriaceae archaeon]|nr:PepSY domain-containing protein [Methanobacteriaceae archaeon]